MELAKIENKYMVALTSGKFLDMNKQEGVKILADIISKIQFEAGQMMSEKDKFLNAELMHDEIKTNFSFIRTEEIRLAFANGVRGEYGEFYGLNIKTFYSWLKNYQTSEKRRLELAKLKTEKEEPVVDKSEARRIYWQKIAKDIQKFKETGNFEPFMPLKMFRAFWNQGLIRITKAEAEVYKNQAMDLIRKERDKYLKPVTKKEHQRKLSLNALISAFESNQLTNEQDILIKERAAELCLKDYFKNCDLNEFINQTK